MEKSPYAALDIMIQHYFHIDPDALDDETYNRLGAGILWLEERQAQIFAQGISIAFGGK